MKSSTNPNIETVYAYEALIELLDESEHHDTVSLTKKLNEIIKKVNKR